MDTLISIKVFCLVVELKSFAAAARRMELSTAMVSKHVLRLESRLATRLLNRTSRSLSLTELGNVYYEQTRRTLADLEDVEASLIHAAVVSRGLLRISAPVWLAIPAFAATLAAYQARHNEVHLEIDLSGRQVNLVDEGYDLALRVSRTLSDSLVARRIARIEFVLVGAPVYLKHAGVPQTLGDLAAHRMLSYSLVLLNGGVTAYGPQGVEKVQITPTLQSTNETLLHLGALQGMGLAFLPRWQIEEDLATGRLQPVLADYRFAEPDLYGVYPSRKHLSSKVRTFLDFFSQHFGDAGGQS